jgi:hypothetical protein
VAPEPEGSTPHSQESATGLYPEPGELLHTPPSQLLIVRKVTCAVDLTFWSQSFLWKREFAGFRMWDQLHMSLYVRLINWPIRMIYSRPWRYNIYCYVRKLILLLHLLYTLFLKQKLEDVLLVTISLCVLQYRLQFCVSMLICAVTPCVIAGEIPTFGKSILPPFSRMKWGYSL